MTATWQIRNGDGYNSCIATLRAGIDADTEILLLTPTSRDLSVFINNPGKETIEFRATNIIKDEIVGTDLIKVVPDIKSIEYGNGFTTSVTAIVFIAGAIVAQDTKISILERMR